MSHYDNQRERTKEDWPNDKRISIIGTNGNTGCHYPQLDKQMKEIPTLKAKKSRAIKSTFTKKVWCDKKLKFIEVKCKHKKNKFYSQGRCKR